MTTDSVDVVVIGLGPGGEAVATELARAGLAVVGVDARLVGGECPYYACVPTKMMIRATDALAEARRVRDLAGSAQVRPDWAPVAARIRHDATDDWDDRVAVERLEGSGARFVRGRGRITAPGEVVVTTSDGERRFRAAKGIVVNPGTDPAVPDIPGLEGTPFWTNREAVVTTRVPASLIVLGGGPVGCELTQVFSRFGAKATLIQTRDRLLPPVEPEASALIERRFAEENIAVHTSTSVSTVSHDAGGFTVKTGNGEALSAETLLVATGRRTDLAALGVGAFGLDESARGIRVDERMRAAPGLWAIGDVTGRGAFTHMSMYQAGIAAADILGREHGPADYRAVPSVTFTDPEVGTVGLTEAEARQRGLTVRTGSADLPATSRGFIHGVGNEGLIKVVEDAVRGVLVGATSVGPSGGEVLGALAVAVHAEVPTAVLRQMIFAYPTFHRGISSALDDLS
ncbi:MAG TPA: NAD(P)/FAD-dependent oxidoreductase [Actinophytocola sp.]|uniref:dihydrolipoyl dehydrogenase family protein n=1 Tax=Actinophytocola sp. TaxID=1872138 RepID=UPI002DDD6ECA|nr:NAD(P)/FAD-dependent oxidoreductase [Actinophytocola sp.]HEV2783133.1 NAD(P)/FAD-dependent oxidoreductase [Actinophytocola sp.]